MKKLEHRIPPPVLMIFTAALMWGAARAWPGAPLPPAPRFWVTTILGVIALVFGASGMRAFLRARTTINPVDIDQASRLVTSGIFRVTRNPMYVGLTALLAGWAIWLGAPWTLAGALGFALFIHRFQILPEERALAAKFGPAFDDYCRRVRRWL